MELTLLGAQATLEPPNPVVPKNISSALRIVVRAGSQVLTAEQVAQFLGGPFTVQAELAGPGLPATVTLPVPDPDRPANLDPLLLPFPALTTPGDYELSNIRIVTTAGASLDVVPARTVLKVIDQILVTSVTTRALTLDEIREKGIVLDRDDYLGFEFTLGMQLESHPVNLSFPVVFDRHGVPVPPVLVPPPDPGRVGGAGMPSIPLPTIVPLLLDAVDEHGQHMAGNDDTSLDIP